MSCFYLVREHGQLAVRLGNTGIKHPDQHLHDCRQLAPLVYSAEDTNLWAHRRVFGEIDQ